MFGGKNVQLDEAPGERESLLPAREGEVGRSASLNSQKDVTNTTINIEASCSFQSYAEMYNQLLQDQFDVQNLKYKIRLFTAIKRIVAVLGVLSIVVSILLHALHLERGPTEMVIFGFSLIGASALPCLYRSHLYNVRDAKIRDLSINKNAVERMTRGEM